MTTTTEWAQRFGTRLIYRADLDNYNPVRSVAHGDLYVYSNDQVTNGIVLLGRNQFADNTAAVYLIDDGKTVEPYFVAAYHGDQDHLILHPFPTNDGRRRPDNGREVDFTPWTLGPRRAYHLKVA